MTSAKQSRSAMLSARCSALFGAVADFSSLAKPGRPSSGLANGGPQSENQAACSSIRRRAATELSGLQVPMKLADCEYLPPALASRPPPRPPPPPPPRPPPPLQPCPPPAA